MLHGIFVQSNIFSIDEKSPCFHLLETWALSVSVALYHLDKRIGKDVDFPDNIGFIIETPGFLPHESGLSNLKHLASIQRKIGLQEIRESMELVGLDPDLKKAVGKYSMGMRQRLGIAQAIMEKPKLLILDEPMNGLDNQGVEHIRSVLLSLKEQGVTIVLASHFKEDISYLCDEVYQMDAGNLRHMT